MQQTMKVKKNSLIRQDWDEQALPGKFFKQLETTKYEKTRLKKR
jgi:hypothetical protein